MRLLDLFCGAGGAATGYHRAGFDVVGVDIKPQHYPFEFVQDDALAYLWLIADDGGRDFDAIHASPPCQAHSDLQKQNKRSYPDLIAPTRTLLEQAGLPYVIENVEGAPLRSPVVLCGTMFPGLRVIRHRLFETSFPVMAPLHPRHPLVFTHDKRKAHHGRLDQDTSFVQVTGGGNATVANKRAAMGIDWMTGAELNEAIPPAYTEHIGHYLKAAIERKDEPMAPSEMPYKRNGCDLCGRVAPLSRIELAPSNGSAQARNYKAPRVAYVCDAHPSAAGPVLRAPAATMAPGTHALSPQPESLF